MAALLRVKRKREDPSPTDLLVEGLSMVRSRPSPSEAFASLQVNQGLPARKRCKYRLLRSNCGHEIEQSLLQEIAQTNFEKPDSAAHLTPTTSSGQEHGHRGTYLQVRGVPSAAGPASQVQIIDLLHQRQSTAQLGRTAEEDKVMAEYYPLVQQYLQQQNTQQQPDTQKSDDEDFVFDYYAMSSSDADTANADLPVIQVREDWLYLDDDAVESEGDSEDSNAEDWYGNDYPSSSQSASSDQETTSDEDL